VEGIGYDFVPDVLDQSLVDRWIKSNDRDSFRVARQLIRQEGRLCGGSSGAAVWAAMEVAKDLRPGARVLVVLPDSVRNDLTKFVDDRWMRENGFAEPEWGVGTVADVLGAAAASGDHARHRRPLRRGRHAVQGARHLADPGHRPRPARRHPDRGRRAPRAA